MSEFRDAPGFYTIYLPDDWSRVVYTLLPFVAALVFGLHAWYTGHIRRHGYPPLVLLPLYDLLRRFRERR